MTPQENKRYKKLLKTYRNDSQLLEFLDLVIKDYNDTALEKLQYGEKYNDVSAMSAGVVNLRNILSDNINGLEDEEEEEEE